MTIKTLIEPVMARAKAEPQRLSLVFIDEDGSEEKITAEQFHQQAGSFAAALQNVGIENEDLVILVLQHSKELLFSFWGALYIGAIPSIFPFLTEKLDPDLYMQRVKTLAAESGVKVLITFAEFKNRLENLFEEIECQVLTIEEVGHSGRSIADPGIWEQPNSDQTAFLQHSSGTTGLQKGVALSHQAVLNQIDSYKAAIELDGEDVIVSWLPLYHDMGLIAGFVMPLVMGVPLVLMSPFHWVRDPKILLWAIHKHKGTLCWLPNFAYNHLTRAVRPQYIEGLDLSSWRAAINCSEPVYQQSHKAFIEKFSGYGFDEDALSVSYAMAENTFAVTQTPIGKAPAVDWVRIKELQENNLAQPDEVAAEGAFPMVSCGPPISGTEVAIVDEDGGLLAERKVGEIKIRGNCMLTEYYNRPEITSAAVRGGWFYSGDMGYIANGELFITGRKKDLIIVGGKNVYPQDLEAIANHIPGIHPGRAVAFGVYDDRIGSEVVVLVCELDGDGSSRDQQEIERQLRKEIIQHTEVTLADVRLVNERWMIKTSSGKIARADNRQKYLQDFRS